MLKDIRVRNELAEMQSETNKNAILSILDKQEKLHHSGLGSTLKAINSVQGAVDRTTRAMARNSAIRGKLKLVKFEIENYSFVFL